MAAIYITSIIYLALIILFALLVIALVIGYEVLRRDFRRLQKADRSAESVDRARRIQEQLGDLKQQLDTAAQASQQEVDRLWRKTEASLGGRLDQTEQTVRHVRDGLGEIRQASERMMQLGTQLAGLSDALRMPPSGASGDGHVWLADLLAQMLPPQHYQLNVSLGQGPPKDAAVRLGEHLIVIDANFSTAAGKARDAASQFRTHVDRIGAECIRPDRGTVDFALMYLPTEGIYYDLVIRGSGKAAGDTESLSNYALARRVIPVSPNTLYAYLYTIVLGLRGLQIEQEAERTLARLGLVRQQFDRLQESFQGLGSQLDHATNRFDQAERQMTRFAAAMSDALGGEGGAPATGNVNNTTPNVNKERALNVSKETTPNVNKSAAITVVPTSVAVEELIAPPVPRLGEIKPPPAEVIEQPGARLGQIKPASTPEPSGQPPAVTAAQAPSEVPVAPAAPAVATAPAVPSAKTVPAAPVAPATPTPSVPPAVTAAPAESLPSQPSLLGTPPLPQSSRRRRRR